MLVDVEKRQEAIGRTQRCDGGLGQRLSHRVGGTDGLNGYFADGMFYRL